MTDQPSRAEDESGSLASPKPPSKPKGFFKNLSKRLAGLSNWAWTLAGISIYLLWEEASNFKSGDGSVGAMNGALILAVVAAVFVFRDWLKPRRLSRVWRVLSIAGVALVCSWGAFSFLGYVGHEWGSCVSGDCQSGYGTFNSVSGFTYEGEWRNGQRGPQGTRRYPDGKTYVGRWVENSPYGQGTTTWPNGDVYVGEHISMWEHGTGTKTYADGRVESGEWALGRLVESAASFRVAAEQGDVDAQYNLGVAYLEGQGVAQDHEEAVRWFRMAAEQGLVEAQYNLALMYDAGAGVAQDHAEAAKWYRAAAEQGLVDAQFNLGVAYHEGQGVAQNSAEAVRWLRMAAEQADREAQSNLAMLYFNGQGVAQDYVEAYAWIATSEAQGHALSELFRHAVLAEMTPSQVESAEELAREYREKYITR